MPGSLHAFVGSVGLAGMDGSLWAVEGGNKYVIGHKLSRDQNTGL